MTWSDQLDAQVPREATHYAWRMPFRSLLDCSEAERDAVVRAVPELQPRWWSPEYTAMRQRVEHAMRDQLVGLGVRPQRQHPHYAIVGRSDREPHTAFGPLACRLRLEDLPVRHTTWTWGDSFRHDPEFREARGDHPASGRVYRLEQMPDLLQQWEGTTAREAWREVEVQLWYDPTDFDVVGV